MKNRTIDCGDLTLVVKGDINNVDVAGFLLQVIAKMLKVGTARFPYTFIPFTIDLNEDAKESGRPPAYLELQRKGSGG